MASENQHDLSQTPCPGCDSAPPPSPLGVLYRMPLGPAAGARQECDFSFSAGLPPRRPPSEMSPGSSERNLLAAWLPGAGFVPPVPPGAPMEPAPGM